MKIIILKIISYLGLGLTLMPSILVFMGIIPFSSHLTLMLIGSLCWFITAPFWINKADTENALD